MTGYSFYLKMTTSAAGWRMGCGVTETTQEIVTGSQEADNTGGGAWAVVVHKWVDLGTF